MRLAIYQVDAFAGRVFEGNPAAICPLQSWLEDSVLQSIAEENNLSETAFFIRQGEDYALRWFTPVAEVDLCGHATLASAFVVFHVLEPGRQSVRFHSRSGPLGVDREGDLLVLDFPTVQPAPLASASDVAEGLGCEPAEVWRAGADVMAVYETEDQVRALRPRMDLLSRPGCRGTIATAPGEDCDFVSRFFAPAFGIPEDPVTGSAHCCLTPFWAKRLGKQRLHARQVSRRGGELFCELRGDRVRIGGRAVLYLEGTIRI